MDSSQKKIRGAGAENRQRASPRRLSEKGALRRFANEVAQALRTLSEGGRRKKQGEIAEIGKSHEVLEKTQRRRRRQRGYPPPRDTPRRKEEDSTRRKTRGDIVGKGSGKQRQRQVGEAPPDSRNAEAGDKRGGTRSLQALPGAAGV